MLESRNPATREHLEYFAEHSDREVDSRLGRAHAAQAQWSRASVSDRSRHLQRVAEVLRENITEYATMITKEMGKPLSEAVAEVKKCAWNFDYYAEHASRLLADVRVEAGAADSRIVYDPLGVVLAIMPWNYPFWQVMRAAAPVLAGGNGMALKHASNVPQCALALEEVFLRAGIPDGLFTTLLVGSSAASGLIRDPRIAAVTFTGSTPVGRQIAATAGGDLKKQVLELGGSDAFIVLDDADVETAAAVGVAARFHNAGQSCISSKRFIVDKRVADDFVEAFRHHTGQVAVGDPMRSDTTMGCMARSSLVDDLHRQVRTTIEQGATLVMGGDRLHDHENFYAPTVLDHVTPSMTAASEETFGPVAAILRVDGPEEAIRVANDTEFGLGAALWTRDLDNAQRLSRTIAVGAVFVNRIVASDPRIPFGGVKNSGYGRELGALGLQEFTNIKTVCTG